MHVEHRAFNSDRKFGVEFEVSPTFHKEVIGLFIKEYEAQANSNISVRVEGGIKGWSESHNNDYWHVKYDSSCGPKDGTKSKTPGWEIASYICQGTEDIDRVANMADYLSFCGLQTNPNCGFHIHVDTSDFSEVEMGILHSHWMSVERVMIHSLPKHRRYNKHCSPLHRRFKHVSCNNPQSLWEALRPDNFCPHENRQKKVAINSVGYAQGRVYQHYSRKTLELRLPECILEKEYVENWIRLYLHFVDTVKNREFCDYSKTFSNPMAELLWVFGLEEKDGDKFVLLSQELYDLKVWFLQRIIRNSGNKKFAKLAREKCEYITQL